MVARFGSKSALISLNPANMAIPAQIKTNLSRALFLLRLLLVVFGLMASTAVVRATTVAAPAFSPAAGTFTNAQTVTISSTTSGASIRYTTSGTAPTSTSGTVYSSPVSIGATAKLEAIAYKSGDTTSAVTSGTYTLTVAVPAFSPAAGTYTNAQTVKITSTTSGATIRYTTSGTAPTSTSGTIYTGPVPISATAKLEAIAYETGYTTSAVTSGTYTLTVAAPTFSPAAGTYTNAQTVTISSITSGATIRYTTSGTAPTSTSGTIYTGPVPISATAKLEAIAYETGYTTSAVTSGTYTLTVAAPTFSPAAGTFTNAQMVTISTTTSGASIRYTTSGTAPTSTSGTIYTGAVPISATAKLEAIAYETGYTTSAVTSGTYTLTVAAPTFSPAAGTYTGAQNVAISTTTSGATIRYTTSGTAPTSTSGTIYTGPVPISATATLEAIAYETGYTTSTVITGKYTIKTTPVISWPAPAPITYGTALSSTQLDATANVPGTFIYTPVAGTILAAGSQPLSVAFTPTDTTDYNNASASVTLTVNAKPVTFTISPVSFTYTGSAQGPAITPSVAGATYSTSGTASATAIGAYSVTATATGNYTGTSGATAWTIAKGTPVISWPAPAAIIYGTALSSTQLDATASVPGTFVYTPAAGAILAAGSQTLSVAFTPTDTTDYNNASASVSLTVNPPPPPLAPVFNSAAGTYTSAQAVTITSAGATAVYYTTDGSKPTSSSPLYSGPILISASVTLQAIGANSAGSSPVASGTYTINIPPFTNTSIPGMSLWLAADTGVTTDANGINTWADQSGNNNNATEAATLPSANTEPTLVTAATDTTVPNGRPVVRFSVVGGWGVPPTAFSLPNVLAGASGGEAFVVLRAAAGTSGGGALWNAGTGGSTNYGPTNISDGFFSTTSQNEGIPNVPLSGFNLYNVSSRANDWDARLNGALLYSTSANLVGDRGATANLLLGAGFTGDVAEVIIYNQVLTPAQRDAVNTYLSNKYNLYVVPLTPTSLTAVPLSTDQVSLQWLEPARSDGVTYLVERSTDGVTFTQVAAVRNSLSYIDTGSLQNPLNPSTSYTYCVRAQGIAGASGYSNLAPVTTPSSGTDMPLDMKLWLKADAGTNGAGLMAFWADQSGNNNNATEAATQPTANTEPTLVTVATDTTVPNGRPVVRFSVVGGWGVPPTAFSLSNVLAGASGGEAFVVLRAAAGTSGGGALWNAGTGGSTNYGPTNISDGFFSTTSQYEGIPNVPLSGFNLYDVSSQTNDWETRLNGTLFYSTGTNKVGDRGATADLGFGADFTGDVAEVIIYNQVLTQAQRDAVNTYLGSKYSLYPMLPNPKNLTAIPLSTDQVSLQWLEEPARSDGVTYLVERSTDGVTFTQVAAVRNSLSYIDTGSLQNPLNPGTSYTYYVQAQGYTGTSGPSNIVPVTTPSSGTDMPLDMKLWLKADAGTNGAGLMAFWADQSGNNNNATEAATQPTANTEPTLVTVATDTTVPNGRPVVRFSVVGGWGVPPTAFSLSNVLAGASGGEAFVVLRAAAGTSGGGALWNAGTGGSTNYGPTNISDGFFSTTSQSEGQPNVPLSNFNLYDVSSQTNDWETWLDGFPFYSIGANTVGDRGATADLGFGADFTGDVAEVIIYNQVLTQAQRNAVGQYLGNKYNISIVQPAAAPVFNPSTGTYLSAQSVAITSPDSGATIRYTTDGSTPSEVNGTVYTGVPVNISLTTTLRAVAYESGVVDSAITNATYTIQAVAPVFSPAPGTYLNVQPVTITSVTPGATIRYTTDGSKPSELNGTIYTGAPVSISSATTLQAMAYGTGFTDSGVTSGTYTLQTTAVVFSPAPGTYANAQSVAITSATNGATIRYTTDGRTPSDINGTVYTGAPVNISSTATLKAMAYEIGFIGSGVTSGTYTLQAAAPVFSLPAGTYASAQAVTIASATSGATIRYTTDGSAPSETNGTVYAGVPVNISSAATLRAMAYESGFTDSTVTSSLYTIGTPRVAAPVFSLGTGTQAVTIITPTSGATIRYTTDGSTPTETTGTLYSGPVSISPPTTLAAMAYESGFTDSPVTRATIGKPTVTITTPANGSTINN